MQRAINSLLDVRLLTGSVMVLGKATISTTSWELNQVLLLVNKFNLQINFDRIDTNLWLHGTFPRDPQGCRHEVAIVDHHQLYHINSDDGIYNAWKF